MSKKKYKKGAEIIRKQIDIHKDVKLKTAIETGNIELSGYYKKEIERLEEQLKQKEEKISKKK